MSGRQGRPTLDYNQHQAEYSAELARIRDAAARAQGGSSGPQAARRVRAWRLPAPTAAEPAVHAPRRIQPLAADEHDAACVPR